MTVLIADDDDDDREFLTEVINNLAPDIEIRHAPSSKETLEVVSKYRVDLVFLELYMPSMNGFELLPKIKEDCALPNCAVVIMSTTGSTHEIEKCLSLGEPIYS